MKILKIFGIVAGIHLFALVVIFANPGCSSTAKRPPQPSDTAAPPITAAPANPSATESSSYYTSGGAEAPSTVSFSPDAPASASPDVRFSPTRPGTPVAGALVTEKVGDVTPVSTYTVQAGDNLWVIARKHELTIAQLTAANNLNSKSTLKPGQKLLIPAKSAALVAAPAISKAGATDKASASTSRGAGNGNMKHVVKSGESLGVIARNYGVKAGDIAVANNISDPAKIRAGTELIIPGWQATGDKKTVTQKKASNGKSPASSSPTSTTRPLQGEPTSAPAPIEPAPFIEQSAAPAPVPVIRIDEGPITSAPKGGN